MFYNIIRVILYPFLAIYLLFNSKKRKFVYERVFQDISFLKRDKNYIWIHCSSVGEITLIDSLVKELKKRYNSYLLITVFTDTGFKVATNKYFDDNRVFILKFPIDDYFMIKKIADFITISYLLIVETEIWPNLINILSKSSKILLVNGRISNRSYPRYMKFKWFLKPLFKKIDRFCMQSEIDRDRIISLGAWNKKVLVSGNLKFDISFEEFTEYEKEELRKQIGLNARKLFVAGSIRSGEYETIFKVFKKLSNTLLVLVPRHIERTPNIERSLVEENLTYAKFSEIEELKNDVDAIIVDRIGVLRKFYSIADIAFVGGTLVDIGGHSLIEPLFYKKTPIFGPYLQNVKDIANNILELNLGYMVKDETEFLKAIDSIRNSSISKDKIDEFFKNNSSASKNILKTMEEI